MKAAVYERGGPPSVLRYVDIADPTPKAGEILIRNEAISIGKDLVKQVAGNEREMTGLSRNVVVGVNRATQIGQIDSTIVGNTHTVMVMPPGEGMLMAADSGGGGGGGGGPTSWTMQQDKITFSTPSGASITLEGDKITIKASGGILVEATGGDVTVKGTPKIKLNP